MYADFADNYGLSSSARLIILLKVVDLFRSQHTATRYDILITLYVTRYVNIRYV